MSDTKVVYQLDAAGIYVGPTEADRSPLDEEEVYLIPAGCVEVAPPEVPAGHVARWQDGAWDLVEDHRGETWYLDGVAAVIAEVGDPVALGYSKTPPPPSMADLRTAKIVSITKAADAMLAAGAPVSGGLHVALDDSSRQDVTALGTTAATALGGAVPWPDSYSRGWISIENVRIPLPTPTDGLMLAASVGNYYAAIVQHRRDLKDLALAATDADDLDAIDPSAGWPTA